MATIQKDVEQQPATDQPATDQPTDKQTETNLENGDQGDSETRQKSPHDEMMDMLAEKRSQAIKKEQDDIVDFDEDNNDDGGFDTDQDPEPDEMVTLKVNGEEIQRTREEVDEAGGVVAIQQQISGDLKLKEAARQRKANDAQLREIEAKKLLLIEEQNRLKELKKTEVKNQDELTEEDVKRAERMTNNLYQGDSEDIKDVMLEVVKATKSKPVAVTQEVDVTAIKADVKAQVKADMLYEAERLKAVALFEKDNADLNVGRMRTAVNDITREVAAEHEDWTLMQIMQESINIARRDFNKPKPKAAQHRDLKNKRDIKKQSSDSIKQANQRRDTSKTQPKAKTFEQLIGRRSHG